MSITDKTRKLLWGKSGNLCALCKKSIIHDATDKDSPSIVGEECHIISRKVNGPRYDKEFPSDKIDDYDNLILLCRVHHKLIDDQPETYPAEKLRTLKNKHEKWVIDKLSKVKDERRKNKREENNSDVKFLVRMNTGSDILKIVGGVLQFGFENDEPSTRQEMELLSCFAETVQDYGELYNELESGKIIEIGFELTEKLEELEEAGFWVFGMRTKMQPSFAGMEDMLWDTGIIQIHRSDNPAIIKFNVENLEE